MATVKVNACITLNEHQIKQMLVADLKNRNDYLKRIDSTFVVSFSNKGNEVQAHISWQEEAQTSDVEITDDNEKGE